MILTIIFHKTFHNAEVSSRLGPQLVVQCPLTNGISFLEYQYFVRRLLNRKFPNVSGYKCNARKTLIS